MWEAIQIFLEKVPKHVNIESVYDAIAEVFGVEEVYHLHVWGLNENVILLTCQVLAEGDTVKIKQDIKDKLKALNIFHTNIEMEVSAENCKEKCCSICDIDKQMQKTNLHLEHCHHH